MAKKTNIFQKLVGIAHEFGVNLNILVNGESRNPLIMHLIMIILCAVLFAYYFTSHCFKPVDSQTFFLSLRFA